MLLDHMFECSFSAKKKQGKRFKQMLPEAGVACPKDIFASIGTTDRW
jgi:hypothetical protein